MFEIEELRGWHRHPVRERDSHVEIQPISVSAIVENLEEALREWGVV